MVKTFKNLAKSYLNYIKFIALKIIERNGYVLLLKNHYSELCSKLYLYEDEAVYLKNYLDSAVKIIDLNCNRYGATENNFEIFDEAKQWKSFGIEPPNRSEEYPSCRWIEGGLSFVPDKLRVCPNCVEGGGTPGLTKFSGGHFSIREVLTIRKLIITANQNGGFNGCEKCPLLLKKMWAPKKFLFDTICLAHYTVCNLACEYCYAIPEGKQKLPLSSIISLKPTFEWLVEEKYLSTESVILWGGGEPIINKEFESLFIFLTRYGATSEVYTNGTILSKTLLEAMINNKASVMISIDAGTKESFNIIKGKNLFEKVVKNIDKYAKANKYKIILKMIICDKNKHEVIPFLNIAEKNDIRIVAYDVLTYNNHVSQEIIDCAAILKYEGIKRGIDVRVGEVGTIYNPNDNIRQRVEQSFNLLSGKNGLESNPNIQSTDLTEART